MACNFLTRMFRRRRRLPSAFSAPTLPASNDKHCAPLIEDLAAQEDVDFFYLGCLSEQGSYTLVVADLPPHVDTSVLYNRLRSLAGCVSATFTKAEDTADHTDLILSFSTAAEAAMALATQPPLNLGDGIRRNIRYADDHADSVERASKRVKVNEPPVPLPRCKICSEEMEGAHSKPCFYCKSTWCYECLQNQFAASLDDQERFPAKCCGRVLHFDVARSVIPENDYTKYRTRFEQHNTAKPIYCASPRCSAFLPPRVAKPNARGQVLCPECKSTTCAGCRVVVDAAEAQNHKCVAADETVALLKQFDYKRCPRCNAGVAKMYGCSHVRCQCGAHWCWDCVRPIQICWSKPCERARQDGDETDDYDIPEDESESESEHDQHTITPGTNSTAVDAPSPALLWGIIPQQPNVEVAAVVPEPQQAEAVLLPGAQTAALTEARPADQSVQDRSVVDATPTEPQAGVISQAPTQAAMIPSGEPATTNASTAAASSTSEPLFNLDGEDADDWEAGDFDFGDEPIDETWDTWGCLHHFNPVLSKAIWRGQKEWLPDTLPIAKATLVMAKQIDCMKCYKTIILPGSVEDVTNKQKDNGKENSRPDSACDMSTAMPLTTVQGHTAASEPPTPTEMPSKKDKKRRRSKKQAEAPSLFNCTKCGVFYCVECKKAVTKEINGLLEKREVRG